MSEQEMRDQWEALFERLKQVIAQLPRGSSGFVPYDGRTDAQRYGSKGMTTEEIIEHLKEYNYELE
jgi:hypothetical protein